MNYVKIIVSIFWLASFSCSDPVNTNTVSSDSTSIVAATNASSINVSDKDSMPSKNYWEQLSIKQVAELILSDSIHPVSSPLVYQMLDSLSSGFKETRQYYFEVFDKIMHRADGEVAESIGGYALTYVQNYPKEFLDNTKSFSRDNIEAWASNIGIELFLASNENVKDAYDHVIVLFNDNCKDCNAYHKSRLKDFNSMIWRTIQENLNAQK